MNEVQPKPEPNQSDRYSNPHLSLLQRIIDSNIYETLGSEYLPLDNCPASIETTKLVALVNSDQRSTLPTLEIDFTTLYPNRISKDHFNRTIAFLARNKILPLPAILAASKYARGSNTTHITSEKRYLGSADVQTIPENKQDTKDSSILEFNLPQIKLKAFDLQQTMKQHDETVNPDHILDATFMSIEIHEWAHVLHHALFEHLTTKGKTKHDLHHPNSTFTRENPVDPHLQLNHEHTLELNEERFTTSLQLTILQHSMVAYGINPQVVQKTMDQELEHRKTILGEIRQFLNLNNIHPVTLGRMTSEMRDSLKRKNLDQDLLPKFWNFPGYFAPYSHQEVLEIVNTALE